MNKLIKISLYTLLLTSFFISFILFLIPEPLEARAGCFLAGTQILTTYGYKNVENINLKDKIISYNIQTHEKEVSNISQIVTFLESDYYIINNSTKVTGTHPFYTIDSKGNNLRIKEVKNLKVGDLLYSKDLKPVEIKQIIQKFQKVTVYNLVNVSPNNNYFANNFLVHNKGGGGGGGGGGHYSSGYYSNGHYYANGNNNFFDLIFLLFLAGSFVYFIVLSIIKYARRKRPFLTDENIISFVKIIVPTFINTFSYFYKNDTQEWKIDQQKNKISEAIYKSNISESDLIKKSTELFVNYQNDWSKKDFSSIKQYTTVSYYSKLKNIFYESFKDNYDISYSPQVLSIIPFAAEYIALDKSWLIREQIYAKVINFEVSNIGTVISGKPYFRNFTEYWNFIINENGEIILNDVKED